MVEELIRRGMQALAGLFMVFAMATTSYAGGPYYLQSGPPPLRFAEPHAVVAPTVRSLILDNRKMVNTNALATVSTNVSKTNAHDLSILDATTNVAGENTPEVITAGGGRFQNPESQGVPASELLIVTPQMVADYFRPVPGVVARPSTNALPEGDVMFRPATPKASAGGTAPSPSK